MRLAWSLAAIGPLLMIVAVILSVVTQTDISLTGVFIWALGLAFAGVGH